MIGMVVELFLRMDVGLGGKVVFADLTGFGLVTRQRQFWFSGLLGRAPEHRLMGRAHEHMLMGLASWSLAHDRMS